MKRGLVYTARFNIIPRQNQIKLDKNAQGVFYIFVHS